MGNQVKLIRYDRLRDPFSARDSINKIDVGGNQKLAA